MDIRHPVIKSSLIHCSFIMIFILFFSLLSVRSILTIGQELSTQAQRVDLHQVIEIRVDNLLQMPSIGEIGNTEEFSKFTSNLSTYCYMIQNFNINSALFTLMLFATYMLVQLFIWKSPVYGLEYHKLPISRKTYYQAYIFIPLLGLVGVYCITFGLLGIISNNMPAFLKDAPGAFSVSAVIFSILQYHWIFTLYLFSIGAFMCILVKKNIFALLFIAVFVTLPIIFLNWVDLLYRYLGQPSPLAFGNVISFPPVFYQLYKGFVFLRIVSGLPQFYGFTSFNDTSIVNQYIFLFCCGLVVVALILLYTGWRIFLNGRFLSANILSPRIKKGLLVLLPFVGTICCLYGLSRFYQIEAILSFGAYLTLGFLLLLGFVLFSAKHWR